MYDIGKFGYIITPLTIVVSPSPKDLIDDTICSQHQYDNRLSVSKLFFDDNDDYYHDDDDENDKNDNDASTTTTSSSTLFLKTFVIKTLLNNSSDVYLTLTMIWNITMHYICPLMLLYLYGTKQIPFCNTKKINEQDRVSSTSASASAPAPASSLPRKLSVSTSSSTTTNTTTTTTTRRLSFFKQQMISKILPVPLYGTIFSFLLSMVMIFLQFYANVHVYCDENLSLLISLTCCILSTIFGYVLFWFSYYH